MNDLTLNPPTVPVTYNGSPLKVLERLDSQSTLVLAGMAFLTTIICVGFVSFSGSEMNLSKDGLSITQPKPAV